MYKIYTFLFRTQHSAVEPGRINQFVPDSLSSVAELGIFGPLNTDYAVQSIVSRPVSDRKRRNFPISPKTGAECGLERFSGTICGVVKVCLPPISSRSSRSKQNWRRYCI